MNCAVILAAGKADLPFPAALTKINSKTLIERTIQLLLNRKFNEIFIVTGYQHEKFEYLKKYSEVKLIYNSDYFFTGTMNSLNKVNNYIKEDFLLIEGDLYFDKIILDLILQNENPNSIVTANLSDSLDEAFIDFDRHNYLTLISKDIQQLTKVSQEMIGISKISLPLFQMMNSLFKISENDKLNYEYAMMRYISSHPIKCIFIENIPWVDIDNEHQLQKAIFLSTKLKKKPTSQQLNKIQSHIRSIPEFQKLKIQNIYFSGGMTNNNFKVTFQDTNLTIQFRLAGEATSKFINRSNEYKNMKLIQPLKLNVPTLYFDVNNGVKITKFIQDSQTLSPRLIKITNYLKEVTKLVYRLHHAPIKFVNEFDYMKEVDLFIHILKVEHQYDIETIFKDFSISIQKLHNWYNYLSPALKGELVPCHNDLVAENFLKTIDNRFYLIDWEYAGMNHPYFDFASLFLESNFSKQEELLFLYFYYREKFTFTNYIVIEFFKVVQDFLWGLWGLIKELEGKPYKEYGVKRYKRGVQTLERMEYEYQER